MKIKNEKQLIKILKKDVKETDKKRIVILAGHFPLIYTKEKAIEAIDKWGEFSIYTLELGCEIAKYAKDIGKEVRFVFFVDDHIYEKMNNLNTDNLKKKRKELYRLKSGKTAKILEVYRKIMNSFGFSEKDIIRHDHKKSGRENCIYFSEKILRKSLRKIDNECAKEYTEFIEDKKYFDKNNNYIITFAPNICKENICDIALDLEIKGLSSSHVFIETMAILSGRKKLYKFGRGVTYRKDGGIK